MINKKWRKSITNWKFINERIIIVEMIMFSREIVIVGVYAPNNDANDQVKNSFWNTLHETIEQIPKRKEIIMMGDMNAKVVLSGKSKVIGRFGERIRNENGEQLIELCEQYDFMIVNNFFQHKDIHKYTWQQNTRELQSIIDYIIVRQATSIKVMDSRVYRGAQIGSDHYLVKTKCLWPWNV